MEKNIAVIFAGGSGTRMNAKTLPKQFLQMNGKPIIIHTLEYFENCKEIDGIVVSCIDGWQDYLKEFIHKFHITKVKQIVVGGKTGQESIYNAISAAGDLYPEEDTVVLIHDGVRPLITEELILENIKTVRSFGTAITVSPVTETVVVANQEGYLDNVVERNQCFHAKAPQSFYLKDILSAHKKAIEDGNLEMIDSATLMSHYGYQLHLVEGNVENIKITNPADFYVFRSLFEARENSQIFGL